MAAGYMDTSERGLRAMTDTDFDALMERCSSEFSRRSLLRDCKADVDKLIDAYQRSVSGEAKDIKGLQRDAMIGPGEQIIVDGKLLMVTGKTYRNVSRAWLSPFKAGPVNFAAGWEQQQGGVL